MYGPTVENPHPGGGFFRSTLLPVFVGCPARQRHISILLIITGYAVLLTICFVSTKTNSMKYFVNWIPLNTHVRFNKPTLKVKYKFCVSVRQNGLGRSIRWQRTPDATDDALTLSDQGDSCYRLSEVQKTCICGQSKQPLASQHQDCIICCKRTSSEPAATGIGAW